MMLHSSTTQSLKAVKRIKGELLSPPIPAPIVSSWIYTAYSSFETLPWVTLA